MPIYEQIKNQIKSAILSGELNEGDILPSVRNLAKDLNCSVITTRKAYRSSWLCKACRNFKWGFEKNDRWVKPGWMSLDMVLEINNLYKRYDDFSLRDINMSLEKGTLTGFIGPNGAGKTTTIKSILNMVRPDDGTITVLGNVD